MTTCEALGYKAWTPTYKDWYEAHNREDEEVRVAAIKFKAEVKKVQTLSLIHI